ncbi:AMP-dependent synthetase and ligase [Mycolicibacterium vanbaalenii PYR-1]|uniref:AMP-dependent synthetase and ligase n=1 Tax=Mycolicibacterium vanbaalenii (strain DSM 7251 / JCM 13017 / BCRC 16820 / KCTC 9966 / NRRL B-24157 / PYR-1) TaxID=350058 RepID=A1T764_MYCVP|nr:AMP-binding protein [Mycolicibacterium vanbaalenii]ABM13014.1 AMP-dependent synthetase and ligase [Mycolicibacterium vanbaalenii PYR-1]
MSPLVDHLRSHGDRPAVLTADQPLNYRELAEMVESFAHTLGRRRRLVLLETRNDVATVVRHLGALAGRHVVLPVPAGRDHTNLITTYRPDVVIDAAGVHVRSEAAHELHDDLALLMSTSGSTGSPKLVRLSRTNLTANAGSIAEYLQIRETDRAATTLPMSYCYGLSVVHSHLLVGAALIMTEQSVADDDFWELFTRHRGTTFAGVPYTFELLDRIGFASMRLPHLRYVTQAGGRMPPERVREYAALADRWGWQLFVMYGATEATARMAYLPPDLALTRSNAIGRPVPGGSFSLEPLDEWPEVGTGELVYRGANVMMGYADEPADLARGATLDALRTGDIARRDEHGLYEIIGRRSRFVKMYGLRIDLQQLENTLSEAGVRALCTDNGDRLAVVAGAGHDPDDVRRTAAGAAGVPAGAVDVACVHELPTLPSGKPDYPTARVLAAGAPRRTQHDGDLRRMFADVLHLNPAEITEDASFVDLGGNSLTYVTLSVRLERALGRLPADWPRLPLRELQNLPAPSRRWWQFWGSTLETSVALRAVAIVLIVGSHAELFELWGGAHILLGVAGYNFGRFCLTPLPRPVRIRHLRTTIAWIAIPSALWVAFALVVTDDYHASNLLLANKFLGPHDSMTAGRLWFVEVLVWTLIALAVLFCIPAVDRLERRHPFALAIGFLAFGMALRYGVVGVDEGRDAWFSMLAFWFFAAGWAASKASTVWQRAAVTAVLVVGLHGYFDDTLRQLLVLTGLALLIWLPAVRCPAGIAVVAGVVAEASLYIYLTHYQVYPLFGSHELVGVVAAVVVGITVSAAVTLARQWWGDRSSAGRMRRGLPLGDEPLLDQGGGEDAVGPDQARGHDAAAPRRGR